MIHRHFAIFKHLCIKTEEFEIETKDRNWSLIFSVILFFYQDPTPALNLNHESSGVTDIPDKV